MRLIKGLKEDEARRIEYAVEAHGPFDTIEDLHRASGVSASTLRTLARADAFRSMGLDRQAALWHVRALRDHRQLPMFAEAPARAVDPHPALPPVSMPKQVVDDYAAMQFSLKAHPISFLRDELASEGITESSELMDERRWKNGMHIAVAGLVLIRQRPATAAGVIFITMEDETGVANLIIRPEIFGQYRRAARHAVAIIARGTIERQGRVVHIMTRSIESIDDRMRDLAARSRDFR